MDVSSGLYNLLYETPYSSGQLFEVCSKSPININIVYTVLFAKIISDASDALFKLIATMQSAYPIKNVPISLIRWCLIGQIRHVYLHQPSMSVAAVNCLERMNIRDIVDLSGSMMPWMVLQSQLVEHSLGDIATLMDSIIGNVGSRKSIDAMVQGLIQIASVGDVEKKLTRIMIGSETCSDIRVLDLHLIKTNAELISSRSCLNLSLAEHVQILCNPGANGRVVERAAFVIPIWRDAMAAYPPSMIVKSLCRTTVEAIISRRHLMGEYDDNDVVLNRVLSMVSQPKSAQNVAAMDEVDLTQPRLLDYSMSRYRSVLPTTVIATVDPIWIEIDPIGNTRMQALERGPTRDEMTNVVSPPGSGRMNITVQGVVWSPKPRTELTAEAEDDDDSVAGRLYHLKKIMKAKSAKQSVPVLFIPYKWMAKVVHGVVTSHTDNVSPGPIYYYISFISQKLGKSIKVFPLMKREMISLTACIQDCSGIQPLEERAHFETILADRLETGRRAVRPETLMNLITHTRQLLVMIDEMTRSDAPVNVENIERLVHSCRCAKPVLDEALVILRKRWVMTNSENVKSKILAVMERLMDPTLISGNNEGLKRISIWMAQLERDMDASKHKRLLRHLSVVRKQVDELIAMRLPSMSPMQEESRFDPSSWPIPDRFG